MALHQLFQLSSLFRSAVSVTLRRNLGISAVLFNKTKELDPVQKLFVDKIREYNVKSKWVSVSSWSFVISKSERQDLKTNLSLSLSLLFFFPPYRSSGGVVDAGPSYQKNMTEEVNKLQRLYGGGDMNKFPDFKFPGQCRIYSVVMRL